MEYQDLLHLLFKQKDDAYRQFNEKIVPTQMKTIGVRSPVLSKIIKQLKKEGGTIDQVHWHDYLEVDFIVVSLTLSGGMDIQAKYQFLEAFLKDIDNWAVVDSASGNFRHDDFSLAFPWMKRFSKSPYPFVRRFSYVHALNNFVDPKFLPSLFAFMLPDDHYYVRMAQAWLLCECFLADPVATEAFLKDNILDDWTINKTISKINDSFRVSREVKEKLKKYRRTRKRQ